MKSAGWYWGLLWLVAACAPPALRLQEAKVAAHGLPGNDIDVKARLKWTGGTGAEFVWEKQTEMLPGGWGPPSVCTPAGCLGPGFSTGSFSLRNRRWHEIDLTFYPEGKPGTATTRLLIYPAGQPGRAVAITYTAQADSSAHP